MEEWKRCWELERPGEGKGEDRDVFGWGRTEGGDSVLRLVHRMHSCALGLPRPFSLPPLLRKGKPPPVSSLQGEWPLHLVVGLGTPWHVPRTWRAVLPLSAVVPMSGPLAEAWGEWVRVEGELEVEGMVRSQERAPTVLRQELTCTPEDHRWAGLTPAIGRVTIRRWHGTRLDVQVGAVGLCWAGP